MKSLITLSTKIIRHDTRHYIQNTRVDSGVIGSMFMIPINSNNQLLGGNWIVINNCMQILDGTSDAI